MRQNQPPSTKQTFVPTMNVSTSCFQHCDPRPTLVSTEQRPVLTSHHQKRVRTQPARFLDFVV